MKEILMQRAENCCELCKSTNQLEMVGVLPFERASADNHILLCANCREQLSSPSEMNVNHWRCLNDSMWNTNDPVQVMVWRILDTIKEEGWPQDLLDMMYLEEDTLVWANAEPLVKDASTLHKDSNGVVLAPGNTVVLIKDLPVKGTGFIAKRGTAVRNIGLSHDDPTHIEGKVNGQHIVILTQYVKKSK